MALPPWTVELLRRGVHDLARQVSDAETAKTLKEQATQLVDELPKVAREKVGTLLRQAESATGPLTDAWKHNEWLEKTLANSGLFGNQTDSDARPRRLINASGSLFHPSGCGVPNSPEAVAAAMAFLSGDCSVHPQTIQTLNRDIKQTLQAKVSLADGEPIDAMVFSSLDAALAASARLAGRGGCLWVPRCDAKPLTFGDRETPVFLADHLRRLARGQVREFGGADRFSGKDWHSLEVDTSRNHVLVHLGCSPIDDLDRLPSELTRVAVLPLARLFAAKTELSEATRGSAQSVLASGADAVVVGGSVLCGTPNVGLLIGRASLLESLAGHERLRLLQAGPMHLAMTAAGLKQHADAMAPVDVLCQTSTDNLRSRAERLATQLTGLEGIASANITDRPAQWSSNQVMPTCLAEQLESRQVVIQLADGDSKQLGSKLGKQAPILLTSTFDEGGLVLDLRWVSPIQQSDIVTLIEASL